MKAAREAVSVAVVLAVSLLLYMPASVQELLFKRVLWSPLEVEVTRFYNDVFNVTDELQARKTWLNSEKWSSIRRGVNVYAVPYLDYKLRVYGDVPAPPLIALLWALITYLALLLTGSYISPLFTVILYSFQAIISSLCVIIPFSSSRFREHYLPLYPLLLTSILALAPYSLDVVSVPLVVLALLEAGRGKHGKAVFYMGLSTGFNYFLLVLFVLYLHGVLVTGGGKVKLPALSGVLLPYVIPGMLNPQYYEWFISGSLLAERGGFGMGSILVNALGQRLVYRVTVGLWLALLVVLVSLTPRDRARSPSYLLNAFFLLFTLHVDAHPRALLPLFFAGAALNSLKPLSIYMLVESCNALVHALHLEAGTTASLLGLIGVQPPQDP
ncbi:MAG: hypothetical protein QXN25_05265, partial [Desulfurococcaceae archaeon]